MSFPLSENMTNESVGNRLGTADRHLISVIGDQVIFIILFKFDMFNSVIYFF